MVGTFNIDLDVLGVSAIDLVKIVNEFDDIDIVVNLVIDVIGCVNEIYKLCQVIEDFFGTWWICCQEIKENVCYLLQIVQVVVDHFVEIDQGFVINLMNLLSSIFQYLFNVLKVV